MMTGPPTFGPDLSDLIALVQIRGLFTVKMKSVGTICCKWNVANSFSPQPLKQDLWVCVLKIAQTGHNRPGQLWVYSSYSGIIWIKPPDYSPVDVACRSCHIVVLVRLLWCCVGLNMTALIPLHIYFLHRTCRDTRLRCSNWSSMACIEWVHVIWKAIRGMF